MRRTVRCAPASQNTEGDGVRERARERWRVEKSAENGICGGSKGQKDLAIVYHSMQTYTQTYPIERRFGFIEAIVGKSFVFCLLGIDWRVIYRSFASAIVSSLNK